MVTPAERFMGHVDLQPSGCWMWMAARHRAGYGKFKVAGRTWVAHRWSYETFVGAIPEGLQLDHLCRNPPCVNPAHLEVVTCRVNLLRGNTFQARNAAKTHCPYGHPLSGDNLMVSGGGRYCRICHRARAARSRAKNIVVYRERDRIRQQAIRDARKAAIA